MRRTLIRAAIVLSLAACAWTSPGAAGRSATPPLLQRFLDKDGPPPTEYRALRHLEAHSEHLDSGAWMDVWTEGDPSAGFHYEIVDEGGSEYVRKHVFVATLEAEKKMWPDLASADSAFTSDNYVFQPGTTQADGLATIVLKPRRKDLLLVDGSIYLRPDDADLVKVEGRMSKAPSFWTRRVDIVRWFQRLAGVRMPVELESNASVLIAGRSTFTMTYEYETVNGQRVGNPQPHTPAAQNTKP